MKMSKGAFNLGTNAGLSQPGYFFRLFIPKDLMQDRARSEQTRLSRSPTVLTSASRLIFNRTLITIVPTFVPTYPKIDFNT